MMVTHSAGQPSCTARCARAYCRSVDSWLWRTCWGEDWRTYTIALRERWCALTLAEGVRGVSAGRPAEEVGCVWRVWGVGSGRVIGRLLGQRGQETTGDEVAEQLQQ